MSDLQDYRSQALLLQAAWLPEQGARAAWRAWRTAGDLDHLAPGLARLLPALYKNLERCDPSDPYLPKLKGIYRRTWYKNQILAKELSTLVSGLQAAGIRVLVVGAMATGLSTYADLACCRVDGLDLVVAPVDLPRAMELVFAGGWKPLYPAAGGVQCSDPWRARYTYASPVSGVPLNLGGIVLPEYPSKALEEAFWKFAVRLALVDCQTLTLSPTDQLLLACIRSTCAYPGSLTLLADAFAVLELPEKPDWERVRSSVAQDPVCQLAADALANLDGILGVKTPALEAACVVSREYQAWVCPGQRRGAGQLWVLYRARYLRMCQYLDMPVSLTTFSDFLRGSWGLWGRREVVLEGLARVLKGLVSRSGG